MHGQDQRQACHRSRMTIAAGCGDFWHPGRLVHAAHLGQPQLPKSAREVLPVAHLILKHQEEALDCGAGLWD
jgi:hypothetical protein